MGFRWVVDVQEILARFSISAVFALDRMIVLVLVLVLVKQLLI